MSKLFKWALNTLTSKRCLCGKTCIGHCVDCNQMICDQCTINCKHHHISQTDWFYCCRDNTKCTNAKYHSMNSIPSEWINDIYLYMDRIDTTSRTTWLCIAKYKLNIPKDVYRIIANMLKYDFRETTDDVTVYDWYDHTNLKGICPLQKCNNIYNQH